MQQILVAQKGEDEIRKKNSCSRYLQPRNDKINKIDKIHVADFCSIEKIRQKKSIQQIFFLTQIYDKKVYYGMQQNIRYCRLILRVVNQFGPFVLSARDNLSVPKVSFFRNFFILDCLLIDLEMNYLVEVKDLKQCPSSS